MGDAAKERNATKKWIVIPDSSEASIIISAHQRQPESPESAPNPFVSVPNPSDFNGTTRGQVSDPSSEAAASFLLTAMLWSITGALILILFWKILCVWYRERILNSTRDPTSDLDDVPLPPGDLGYPLFGETFKWLTEGTHFNANRRKKYGNVFKTNVLFDPMIKVTGHDFVKEVLASEHDKVTTDWPYAVKVLLGSHATANIKGAAHYQQRKTVLRAFSRQALDNYIPVIRKECENMMECLKQSDQPKILHHVENLTFNVALSVLIGIKLDDVEERRKVKEAFIGIVSNILSIPVNIPGLGFNKGLKSRAELFRRLQKLLDEKRRELNRLRERGEEEDSGTFRDAFTIMHREIWKQEQRLRKEATENNNNNDDDDNNQSVPDSELDEATNEADLKMKELVLELMFAGYATTSSVLTSAILEIANHPEVFRSMEEEFVRHGVLVDQIGMEGDGEELDLLKIHKLSYLDQVVKETLRKRPAVLGGYRRAKKTFELGGYKIPKGWKVIYNILDTHEFENGDMDNFDPDRFAKTSNGRENKYRFIPFGCGPRICVGQDFARLLIKLSLIEFVRHFRGVKLTGSNPPKMKFIPTIRPIDGLPAQVFPRDNIGVL